MKTNVLNLNQENEDNPFYYCNDSKNPCKCHSDRRAFVDKYDKVHWYTEHTCNENQDSEVFEKLRKVGLSMECKQLKSTLVFNLCDKNETKVAGVVEDVKSGCEIRYVDQPKTIDGQIYPILIY